MNNNRIGNFFIITFLTAPAVYGGGRCSLPSEFPSDTVKFIERIESGNRTSTNELMTFDNFDKNYAQADLQQKMKKLAKRSQFQGKAGTLALTRSWQLTTEHGVAKSENLAIGVAAMLNPYAGLAAFGSDRRAYPVLQANILFYEGMSSQQVAQLRCDDQTACVNKIASILASENKTEEEIANNLKFEIEDQKAYCK